MPIAKWHWDTLIPILIPSLLLCSSLFFLFLLRHIWWCSGFTPGPYSEITGLRKPYGIWWFKPGINNCIQDKSCTHVYHFSPLLLLLLLCFLFHFILEPVLVVRRPVSSDLFPGLHSYITPTVLLGLAPAILCSGSGPLHPFHHLPSPFCFTHLDLWHDSELHPRDSETQNCTQLCCSSAPWRTCRTFLTSVHLQWNVTPHPHYIPPTAQHFLFLFIFLFYVRDLGNPLKYFLFYEIMKISSVWGL